MNQFSKDLLTEWRKLRLPFEDETFVVAVSGGADSVSLALALQDLRDRRKLGLRFVIAHFNHRLRGSESLADEAFVKSLAGKFHFELTLESWSPARAGNLEQNARLARYQFLNQTAVNLNARGILTAHTLNDQAETFLINLIRGSGLEGLGGMKSVRLADSDGQPRLQQKVLRESAEKASSGLTMKDAEIRNPNPEILLVRPMLRWATRKMTERYCHDRNVEYRYDTMNEDLAFQRVRIRKILLPLLEDLNPNIVENLAKTASLLQDDFAALETLSAPLMAELRNRFNLPGTELPIKELSKLVPAVRRKVIRDWLRAGRGDLRRLETKHFAAIENLISSRKSGTVVELPGRETIRKTKGMIVFMKNGG